MPRLDSDRCRTLFAAQRSYRLATVGPGGAPHLVPVTAALIDDVITFAVDHKPKSTDNLRRLDNLAAEPRAAFLADAYTDDWSALWWVRADTIASIVRPGDAGHAAAIDALVAKYEQYRSVRPTGVVVSARVARWSGWTATSPETGKGVDEHRGDP